jgi:anti-sigma factor RsiW
VFPEQVDELYFEVGEVVKDFDRLENLFDLFTELLDALCEGAITPEQIRHLEEILLASPAAEAFYVQYMSLYADLARHFGSLPVPSEQSLRERTTTPSTGTAAPVPAPVSRRRRQLFWGALGLAGMAAGVCTAAIRGFIDRALGQVAGGGRAAVGRSCDTRTREAGLFRLPQQ